MSAKNWCFTWNNPDLSTTELQAILEPLVGYAVFQLESGQLGTPHFQGYAQFTKRYRLSGVRKILKAHWSIAKGTPEQNTTYCTKEPRLEESVIIGNFVAQGQRTDIEAFRDAILEGKRNSDLIQEHLPLVAKYPKLIEFIRATACQPRHEKPTVICLYGASGTGKTHTAVERSGRSNTYVVSRPDTGRPLWWDGYNATIHKSVVFDDFYGWLPWSTLLQLLDKYAYQVEYKGGKTEFNSPYIYLTSNQHPSKWYKNVPNDDMTPLLRRIDEIIEMNTVFNI